MFLCLCPPACLVVDRWGACTKLSEALHTHHTGSQPVIQTQTPQQLSVTIFRFHVFSNFVVCASHNLAFSRLHCCSQTTFPGIVRAVAVVVAAMSESFPCSFIGRSLFPLQALGVHAAGLCPAPLTLQWGFMLPRLPSPTSVHQASSPQGHKDSQGAPRHQIANPVLSISLSWIQWERFAEEPTG